MKTKQGFLILRLGCLICTALLLVCLAVTLEPEYRADIITLSHTVNYICLRAEHLLSLSVFSAVSADILLYKKAR